MLEAAGQPEERVNGRAGNSGGSRAINHQPPALQPSNATHAHLPPWGCLAGPAPPPAAAQHPHPPPRLSRLSLDEQAMKERLAAQAEEKLSPEGGHYFM